MPRIPANETNLFKMAQEPLLREQRFLGDVTIFFRLLRHLEEKGILGQLNTTVETLFRVALEEARNPEKTDYSAIQAAFNVLEAQVAFQKELHLLNSFYNFVLSQASDLAKHVDDYIAHVHTFAEFSEYASAVTSNLDDDNESLKRRSVELFGTILAPSVLERLYVLLIRFVSTPPSQQHSEDD